MNTASLSAFIVRTLFLTTVGSPVDNPVHTLKALPAPPARPNIVLFILDDHGYEEAGCYGAEVELTPHLDALTKENMRFTHAFANTPICSPAGVDLLTGRYPQHYRVHSHFDGREKTRQRDMVDFLDPNALTLTKALNKAGYRTALFGKWHMSEGRDVQDAPPPTAYCYEESFVNSIEGMGPGQYHEDMPKSRSSYVYVDKALDFIWQHKDDPFFVNLCPNHMYAPFMTKSELKEKYARFAGNPYQQQAYCAVLENRDNQIGRLLQTTKELGLDENTIVVFARDNGPTDWSHYYKEGYQPPGSASPFFGRKWSLCEGGIRVPFIIRWKDTIPAGQTNDQTVLAAMVLYPSLCAITGAKVYLGEFLNGLDMSRALPGKSQIRKPPFFRDYRRNQVTPKPGNPKFVSPNLAMRKGDGSC